MNIHRLQKESNYRWRIEPTGAMRVPAILFGSESLLCEMDDKVYEQITNVATLSGIVGAAYAMPDAHWGYGFPIGGVAAFDPDLGGVISAGGVGFDISCGVRTLHTGLTPEEVIENQRELADILFRQIPAGLGSTGAIHLDRSEMDAMLTGGARWAVERGYGEERDLERIEEYGAMAGADPDEVSDHAKKRQRSESSISIAGERHAHSVRATLLYLRHFVVQASPS